MQSGIQIGSTRGPDNFFAKTAQFFSFLPTVDQEGHGNHVGYSLAQETYTPLDVSLPAPPPGDQPYAGILLANAALYSRTPESQHTFLFAVGAVGPISGAEYTQKLIHDITGAPEPMGWDTQLGNELQLNMGYAYEHRLVRLGESGGSGLDLSAGVGAALGNCLTSADGSATLRFGYDLPEPFGKLDIRSRSTGSIALPPLPRNSGSTEPWVCP